MNEKVLLFDTYAFFEIIRGNPNYAPYRETVAITTIFNMAELNYGLKKEMEDAQADELTTPYEPFVVEVSVEDVEKAMSFRRKNKQLSIPDAIGYTMAQKYQVKFLTGDEDFRNLPGVEFVK